MVIAARANTILINIYKCMFPFFSHTNRGTVCAVWHFSRLLHPIYEECNLNPIQSAVAKEFRQTEKKTQKLQTPITTTAANTLACHLIRPIVAFTSLLNSMQFQWLFVENLKFSQLFGRIPNGSYVQALSVGSFFSLSKLHSDVYVRNSLFHLNLI